MPNPINLPLFIQVQAQGISLEISSISSSSLVFDMQSVIQHNLFEFDWTYLLRLKINRTLNQLCAGSNVSYIC